MSNLLERILGRGPVHTPISQEPPAFQQRPPSNVLSSAPWSREQYFEPPQTAEYMQPMSTHNNGPSPTVEPPHIQQYQFASSRLPPQQSASSHATHPDPSAASSAGAGQQLSTGSIPSKNNAQELPVKVPRNVSFEQRTPEIIVRSFDTASPASLSPIIEVSPYFADPDPPTVAPPVGENPLISPGLIPPVSNFPMSTPGSSIATTAKNSYNTDKPTRSLRQIQTVLASRYPDKTAFELATKGNAQLIVTDKRFFKDLRRMYLGEMSGIWRQWFSLKTLTGFRLLSYSPETRPIVVPMDEFILQEMFYAYEHPKRITSQNDWIEWVFLLRHRDKRHALEFVEGWNSTRVTFAGNTAVADILRCWRCVDSYWRGCADCLHSREFHPNVRYRLGQFSYCD